MHATKTMHIVSTRAGGDFSFDIQILNGNTIHADIGNGSGWLTTNANATYNYTVNTWFHITYVVTPANYKIYVNENLLATGTYSGIPLFLNATHQLELGCHTGETTFFKGQLDEVRIWNRALTRCEIVNNLYGELSSGQTGLTAYYQFNQGVAAEINTGVNILADSGGNAYSGTLNGFALSGSDSNWAAPGAIAAEAVSPLPESAIPGLTVVSPQTFSFTITVADLTATGAGTIKWYASAIGGNEMAGTTVLTTGTYYVAQTLGGCERERIPVEVFSQPGGLHFNGYDSGGGIPPYFYLGGAFTVELWVRPNEATKTMHLISTRDGNIYTDYGFDIQLMNGNTIHSNIGNGNSWITTSADATFNYTPGVWFHLAYTVNSSGYQIYANGALVGSGTYSGVPLFVTNLRNAVQIGYFADARPNAPDTRFSGDMDELRIWSRALTQCEIRNNMNAELPPLNIGQTDVVIYLKFNDATGTMGNDSSGNRRHAFLNRTGWVAGKVNTGSTGPVFSLLNVTSPQNLCSPFTVANLAATGSGIINWFADSQGGTPLSGTTSLPYGTYYVSQTVMGCECARTPVSVTIRYALAPTGLPIHIYASAVSTLADLTVAGTNIKWYAAESGGDALPATTLLVDGTTYYATQTTSCGESLLRLAVTVRRLSAATQTLCSGAKVSDIITVPSAGQTAAWYTVASGGTPLPAAAILNSGTYYVQQGSTALGLQSNRIAIAVVINSTPVPIATAQTFCSGANPVVSNLTATGMLPKWYAAATGGQMLDAAIGLVTGTYYVSQTLLGCESGRTAVAVTVNPSPQPPVAFAQTRSSGTVADLIATGVALHWYAALTGGNALPAYTILTTGTYYVSQTVSGCESTRTAIQVTITQPPLHYDGAALNFEGAANYVSIPNGIAATDAVTFEAWIYPKALNGVASILSHTNTGTGTIQWEFSDTALHFNLGGSDYSSNYVFSVGSWHHIAVSYSKTGAKVSFYVNGSLTNSSIVSNPVTIASGPIEMGAWQNSQNFNGLIDEVRIWDRALTECEIQNDSNGELASGQTGLVAYYQFNQGFASGSNANITSLEDSSGHHNDGLLTGFALTGPTSNWVSPGAIPLGSTAPVFALLEVAGPQSFCLSATVADLNISGTDIQWYASETDGLPLSTDTALTTGTYYASQSACGSIRKPVSVTINEENTPVPVVTEQTFCNSATVSDLTALGTGLKWYTEAVGGIPLAAATPLATATYYVSQTINSCESAARAAVPVAIDTIAAPLASPQYFCTSGKIADLTASGTGLKWYDVAVGGPVLTSGTALVTATYYVSQTIGTCESARSAVAVTVNLTLQVPVTTAQTFCPPVTVANLADIAIGTDIKWYSTLTGGTPLSNSMTLQGGTYTYYASQTLHGCETVRKATAITVTYNTPTIAPTGPGVQVYSKNTTTLADLTVNGTNIKWYDGIYSSTLLPSTTVVTDGLTYYASQTAPISNCTSAVRLAVTVRKISAESQAVCNGTKVSDLVTTPSASQAVSWFSSASGGTALSVDALLSSGTYYIQQTNSNRAAVNIIVTTIPPPVATAQAICSTASIAALTATGTNLRWYAVATGGSPLTNNIRLAAGTYYVSQTVNGCESARTAVPLTMAPFTVDLLTASACGSYTWALNGQTYTASGTYLYTSDIYISDCHITLLNLTIDTAVSYYADADGDGFGAGEPIASCLGQPAGTSANSADCNDADSSSYLSGIAYIDADGDEWDAGQAVICHGAAVPAGYSLTTKGTDCNDSSYSITNACALASLVNLKLFIEGYYIGGGMMASVKRNQTETASALDVEDMTVELHHPTTYELIKTATGMLHTDGTLSVTFNAVTPGNYYVAVKGGNIIETWSNQPQALGSAALTYDFTTSAAKAYGNNMVQLNDGPWAMMSGDMNHDGIVDPSDYAIWELDFNNFSFGVFATDLNGDGIVDPSDYAIWELNFNKFIFAYYPF
jgi:hypothetical protein